MAHTITLSDEDYAALAAAAERTGETIEQLMHQAIGSKFQAPRSLTSRELPIPDRRARFGGR